jgi:NADH-quinone oxidoreductase subunit A
MATPVSIVAYLSLFFIVGFVFLLANLLVGWLVRPIAPNPEKLTVYECGEPTIGSSFVQFDLRFYVVALLFLVFDVEVAFFFPWATVFGTATHLMDPNLEIASGSPLVISPAVANLYNTLGAAVPEVGAHSQAELAGIVRNSASTLAWVSILDIGVFFAVLLVGFAYVWRRGDIDWVRAVQAQRREEIHRRAPTFSHDPAQPALAR